MNSINLFQNDPKRPDALGISIINDDVSCYSPQLRKDSLIRNLYQKENMERTEPYAEEIILNLVTQANERKAKISDTIRTATEQVNIMNKGNVKFEEYYMHERLVGKTDTQKADEIRTIKEQYLAKPSDFRKEPFNHVYSTDSHYFAVDISFRSITKQQAFNELLKDYKKNGIIVDFLSPYTKIKDPAFHLVFKRISENK